MIQTHGHGILKSSYFSLCLIVGLRFISRVLVLQKTNNVSFEMPFLWDIVFTRCHFYELPFMFSAIFMRWYFWQEECAFCNTVSMSAINKWGSSPLLMLYYIGRVAPRKLGPRNCLRYLETTLKHPICTPNDF